MIIGKSGVRIFMKEDLDKMTCSCCGKPEEHRDTEHSTEFYLHSRCHPEAKTVVRYQGGAIEVTCGECNRHVAAVAVMTAAQAQLIDVLDGLVKTIEGGAGPTQRKMAAELGRRTVNEVTA